MKQKKIIQKLFYVLMLALLLTACSSSKGQNDAQLAVETFLTGIKEFDTNKIGDSVTGEVFDSLGFDDSLYEKNVTQLKTFFAATEFKFKEETLSEDKSEAVLKYDIKSVDLNTKTKDGNNLKVFRTEKVVEFKLKKINDKWYIENAHDAFVSIFQ